ncbi:MAG: 7-cyano-7-deazaguanine synthase [Elusimicrobia bacterium]|nr:7-cyano-7-deazaguanine synthase [Elusimicrobiota bacterium]
MNSGKVCVLASGGLDSSVLIADLLRRGHEVRPLYVRSGFGWEKTEEAWLKKFLRALACPGLRPLAILEVPMRGLLAGHWSLTGREIPPAGSPCEDVYLPGRNLVLLSHAGMYCARRGIPVVALAILKGNPFLDARPAFFKSMEITLDAALGFRIKIMAPYRRRSKQDVARLVPGFPAELTFSCLRPQGLRHCGRCSKCEEREAAISRFPPS